MQSDPILYYYSETEELSIPLDFHPEQYQETSEQQLISKIQTQLQEIQYLSSRLPCQSQQNPDFRLITDYDDTMILQSQNKSSERILGCSRSDQFLLAKRSSSFSTSSSSSSSSASSSSSFRQINSPKEQLLACWLENLSQFTRYLNLKPSSREHSFLLRSQCTLLNFLLKMLKIMVEFNIGQLTIISNSSVYLLGFGLLVLANYLDVNRNVDTTLPLSPVAKLVERGVIKIESTSDVASYPQKLEKFFQVVDDSPHVQYFVSIGDGQDEYESAIECVNQFGVNFRIYRFSFSKRGKDVQRRDIDEEFMETRSPPLCELIAFHDFCFKQLQTDIKIIQEKEKFQQSELEKASNSSTVQQLVEGYEGESHDLGGDVQENNDESSTEDCFSGQKVSNERRKNKFLCQKRRKHNNRELKTFQNENFKLLKKNEDDDDDENDDETFEQGEEVSVKVLDINLENQKFTSRLPVIKIPCLKSSI